MWTGLILYDQHIGLFFEKGPLKLKTAISGFIASLKGTVDDMEPL